MMRLDANEIKYWINKTIPNLLKTHFVPGAAVAIFIDGEVVFKGGWGIQNYDDKNPVDEHTVFDGASLAKPVFS
jgi:CubicO group peptidase (beta-lactamase class C family)